MKCSLISVESSVVAIESSPADIRGASAETVKPVIVVVIAVSYWIRLSRERVCDSVVFALTGIPLACLAIGLVYTRVVFYVDCVARVALTMCSSR